MWSFLLDLLFPKHSLLGDEREWITENERQLMKLSPIRLHRELLRKKHLKSLDCLIAAGHYQHSPLLRKAIKTFKYGRIPELGPELAMQIVQALPGLLLLSPFHGTPVLCPVPLHWRREFERGFNQSKILADIIGSNKNWQVQELLKRTRATGHQAWRKRETRLSSMTGAFAYSGPSPAPKIVLLVDDISTTGATLDSCALELKKAGVKHVVGLVIAYG